MNFRSKSVGWRNDSYRHYLAAKGIKTKKSNVEFGREWSHRALQRKFSKHDDSLIKEYEDYGVLPSVENIDVEEEERCVQKSIEKKGKIKEEDAYFAKKVDLNKYAGTWKQESVKNEPWFQKGCKNVTAKYTPVAGGIQVVNTCVKNGKKTSVKGFAVPVSKDNRKLAVDFGTNPFNIPNYEIVKVNPNYTKATVRGGKTVWRLTR